MIKSKYTEGQIKLVLYAKALSHPVQMQLMEILSKQSCCCSGDIANDLRIARSTLSQHLNELKNAGLIQGEIKPPKIKCCICGLNSANINGLWLLLLCNTNAPTKNN